MKRKNLILIALAVAIVSLSLWWFMRPTAAAPKPIAEIGAPALSKIATPKPIASPAIAPPVVSLAPKPDSASVATAQSVAAPLSDPNADSKAELNTALEDMARLQRAGHFMEFAQTYDTPDEWAKEEPRLIQGNQLVQAALAQDPELSTDELPIGETYAQSYEALEKQTPTFNASGDEATYTYMSPTDSDIMNGVASGTGTPTPLVFVKINGKWYLKKEEAGN